MKNIKHIRISLSIKLVIVILTTATIAYLLSLQYINYDFQGVAVEQAKKISLEEANSIKQKIKIKIDNGFSLFRTYSYMFEEYDKLDSKSFISFFNKGMERALNNNPDFVSTWSNWELRFIDSSYTKNYGRVSHTFYRQGDYVMQTVDSLNMLGDDTASLYYKFKTSKQEGLSEPYFYTFSGTNIRVLMTSIIVPFTHNNEYAGMIGCDISLDRLRLIVDSISTANKVEVFVLSNKGTIVAHSNVDYLGKSLNLIDSTWDNDYHVFNNVKRGQQFGFETINPENKERCFMSFVPITFGHDLSSWSIAIVTPIESIMKEAHSHILKSRKIGIWGLILLFIISIFISLQIIRPLKRITKILRKLAKGDISNIDNVNIKSSYEIEQISNHVDKVVGGFKNTLKFAENIKEGKFEFEYKVLSDKDTLGNAMVEMKNSLKEAQLEDLERKKEDEYNVWLSKGINIFETLLRQNHDLEKLSVSIISNLIEYIGAHQGGLYLTNKTKNYTNLELVASIGFDKDRLNKRYVEPNEGDVGVCFLEKERIYKDDISKDYNPITSGLGKSIPGGLLIVPMLLNDDVVGVIEIESLKPISENQIKFVERIAVSIATTIASAKINNETAKLLDESKKQADELAQQEEEMRQNMEELQAMQEEAKKRQNSMLNYLDSIKKSIYYIEYDMNANITDVNDNVLQLFHLKREQVVGKPIGTYDVNTKQAQQNYKRIWDELRLGKPVENNFHTKYLDREFYLKEFYRPVKDATGVVYKVVNIIKDVTDEKKKEQKLEELNIKLEKLKRREAKRAKYKENQTVELSTIMKHASSFKHIDLSHLGKVYKNDFSKIKKILKIYLDTIPQQINEIENFDRENLKLLLSKVNIFKTKMIYIGQTDISQLAKQIEEICVSGHDVEKIDSIIDQIKEQWTLSEKELNSIDVS